MILSSRPKTIACIPIILRVNYLSVSHPAVRRRIRNATHFKTPVTLQSRGLFHYSAFAAMESSTLTTAAVDDDI